MADLGSIFISYRRSDSTSDTGRIYDHLEHRFGRTRVFKDVDSIPLGVNFREFLNREVAQCHVLIAVIGSNWLVPGKEGRSKLEDPNDWVRLEIEAALQRKIPVIPLLVNGAEMPRASELPESLKVLSEWQSMRVRPDPDFRKDISKLIDGIERLFSQFNDPSVKTLEVYNHKTQKSIAIDLDIPEFLARRKSQSEENNQDNEISISANLDIPEFLLRRRNR